MFEQIKIRFEDSSFIENKELSINKEGKIIIRPDFYSSENKIIGEIHAHIGRLKGSQPDKIASDVLKMVLYEKVNGCKWNKYIAVCCKEELEQLKGKSFLAEEIENGKKTFSEAIREYKVEVLYIDLPENLRFELAECMKRQNLMK